MNAEGETEAEIGAEVVIHNIPIFQFLVFYAGDLEILPGPDMNLSGRIHANGDLYLNAGATLTIGDRPSPPNLAPGNPFVQVSAAGQIIRGRKENSQCGGTVLIDKLEDSDEDGDLDALELACSGGSRPVPQAILDTFLGSLEAGIDTIQIPSIDDLLYAGEGQFWQRADVRIVLRLDLAQQAIDFSAPGLCPGGPGNLVSPALFPIEVQDATGMRDPVKTNALWRFMCERRGAIFYNEMPNNVSNGAPNDQKARDPNDYTPPFGGNDGTNGGAEQVFGDPSYNNYLVYRRAGEDTNGDGFINTIDFNPDICPDDVFDGNPWWEPAYCANFDADGLPNSAGRWFADTDYRRGGYYNHREDEWLYLLNVNMRALIEWNQVNGGPLFPPDDQTNWGVVVFLSVQGPLSTLLNNYAVRVFDSADL